MAINPPMIVDNVAVLVGTRLTTAAFLALPESPLHLEWINGVVTLFSEDNTGMTGASDEHQTLTAEI